MLDQKQVEEIWERQWELLKPFLTTSEAHGQLMRDRKDKLPELWPGFIRAWEQREELRPHIETGVFPEKLFRKRAPNQSEEELQYIKDNFKPITLPVYSDWDNTICRALHPQNWSIDWDEQDERSAKVKEYVTKGIKEWGSLENFMRRALVKLRTMDAMGLTVFLPTSVPALKNESTGDMELDPDREVKPEINYFDCTKVWGFEYDSWYLVRLHSSSMVTHGHKDVEEGIRCWLIDDTNVWLIEQFGRKNEFTFNKTKEFSHNTGEAPCIHNGGVSCYVDGRLFMESPFMAAKGVLDTALADAQYLQVSKVKCVYPHVVMVGDDCDYFDQAVGAKCFEGSIEWTGEGGKLERKDCPKCSGTSKRRRLSPTGELLISPKVSASDLSTTDGLNATNALAFVGPSTETVKFIREEVEHNIQKGRSIMHLNADAPMTGGDQKTATEAGLNNRAKDAFVMLPADQTLTIFEFGVKMIGKIMVGPDWEGFTLRRPTHYDLRNEADHITGIAAARENDLPPAMIDEMEGDLIAARYANDPDMQHAMEVITMADRLGRMSKETITAEASAGRVQDWEILLHYSALSIYRELSDTDTAFAASDDVWEKVATMHAKAKEKAPVKKDPVPSMAKLGTLIGMPPKRPGAPEPQPEPVVEVPPAA